MEKKLVQRFRSWFDDYVAGFYGDDDYVNANIKLKQDHSKRVCDEIRYLADELAMSENQKRIAEVTALFHDIGRFEQFKKYRTYNDQRSVNHNLLALEVLAQTGIMDMVERGERQLIEKAIEYHGCKELPADFNGETLLFSRLIRDADKLDIFYIVTEYYGQYEENPADFKLELEMPDEDGYSKQVVEDVLSGRRVDYSLLRTLNDVKILQLGWVYDVNFIPTLRRISERRFLDGIIAFLPDTEDVRRVGKRVKDYVRSRLEQ